MQPKEGEHTKSNVGRSNLWKLETPKPSDRFFQHAEITRKTNSENIEDIPILLLTFHPGLARLRRVFLCSARLSLTPGKVSAARCSAVASLSSPERDLRVTLTGSSSPGSPAIR